MKTREDRELLQNIYDLLRLSHDELNALFADYHLEEDYRIFAHKLYSAIDSIDVCTDSMRHLMQSGYAYVKNDISDRKEKVLYNAINYTSKRKRKQT